MKNKLTNFPPVYYISLSDSIDRQQSFENQFLLNGIENVKMIEAYDGRKINYCIENDTVDGIYFHQLDSGGIAATISHLKAIKEWYNSSDSEYAIFFEDDMTIQSANDWNFTWEDFVSSLPKNWKAIQLSLIKEHGIEDSDMKLNQREWWNWSAGSYLIRRNYAKELIEHFYQENKYSLKIKDHNELIPCIEYCLFSLANMNVYTIPLFYENTNFVSTFYQHFIEQTHKGSQIDSSNYVKYWWKIKGQDKNLDELIHMENIQDGKSMKIVQIGTNKANDDLSNYLLSNYDELEFGLFVDANILHIDDIKNCYSKFNNIEIENVAIKTPLQNQNTLTIYYHTNEHPHYSMASCDIEHIKKHMTWCPHLQGGEIKSFEVACITLEELLEKHSIYEIDWLCLDIEGIDAEILLTFDWNKYRIKRVEFEHLHLGYYKSAIKNMMIGMGYEQVDSLHEYDWAFENKNIIFETQKLKNFPSVNFVSIEESQDRRNVLYEMFEKYGISNVTPHIYKRYSDEDHKIIEGPLINHTGKGVVTSHLKAIREWYESTDEEYTLICEDDFSFDTVKYWNFTWKEFFRQLPKDWNLIQLCLIREDMFCFFNPEVKLRNRCWCDWSACAYLISRKHAENLIKNYYPDDFIHLEYKGTDKELREREETSYWFCFPSSENIIYSPFEGIQGGIYTFPLFVENVSFNSTWSGTTDNWLNRYSHDEIMNWWKTKGQNKNLEDFKL
jgi:GR25 family glycosyltransferase involved in LPS biosynthesis